MGTSSDESELIQRTMRRIVDDGNLIQTLIFKLDMLVSDNNLDKAYDTLGVLQSASEQLSSDNEMIFNLFDFDT